MGVIEKRGLLVLSRKRDEGTVIIVPPSTEPTLIEAITLQVREGKVRTGWRADPKVKIYRAEVAAAIERDGLKEGKP